MTNAQWARAALFAVALPACATAHGPSSNFHARADAPRASTDATASLNAGRAAQPGSWIPGESREAPSLAVAGPGGQAAQPGSWLPPSASPAPSVATPLADDGPSYLGGRAGQPYSWHPVSKPAPKHSEVAGL